MQCMNIEQNNKWEALISFLGGGGGGRKNTFQGIKEKKRKRSCKCPLYVEISASVPSNTVYKRIELT